MRWQPGQSGNPAGRRPRRLFDERLREALSSKRGEKAKDLVEKLILKASTGNVAALKLVCERVGGKPKSGEAASASGSEQPLTKEQIQQRIVELLLSSPELRQTLLTSIERERDSVVQ